MIYLVLVLIVACAEDLFYLIPYWHVPGTFRVSDVGLLILFMSLAYYAVFKGRVAPLWNGFSIYIYAYLCLVLLQAGIAAMRYPQGVLDGVIVARHQFYYLFFPLVLMALDSDQRIERFLNTLTAVGLGVIVLSLINYSGITLFHYKWADGHGLRSGIVRAFIPGMSLIVLTALWQFNRYVQSNRLYHKSVGGLLVFLVAILFRQTRGRILATGLTMGLMLYVKRRIAQLSVLSCVLLLSIGILALTKYESVASELAQQTYRDVVEGEGTVGDRLLQVEQTLELIKEYPLLGTGGLVLRADSNAGYSNRYLESLAYASDLGYVTWVKFYGFVGVLMLIYQITIFYAARRRARGASALDRAFSDFASYHYVAILISTLTIPYFTEPAGIVMLTLTWALLARGAERAPRAAALRQEHAPPSGPCPGHKFREMPIKVRSFHRPANSR